MIYPSNFVCQFQVVKLRETAIEVTKALGRIDERDLPPFIRPVKRLVMHVTKLFNDIKSDVMTFYNVNIILQVDISIWGYDAAL